MATDYPTNGTTTAHPLMELLPRPTPSARFFLLMRVYIKCELATGGTIDSEEVFLGPRLNTIHTQPA